MLLFSLFSVDFVCIGCTIYLYTKNIFTRKISVGCYWLIWCWLLGAHAGNCLPDEFRCSDGITCVPNSRLCDDTLNPPDNSDEMNCHHHRPGLFLLQYYLQSVISFYQVNVICSEKLVIRDFLYHNNVKKRFCSGVIGLKRFDLRDFRNM